MSVAAATATAPASPPRPAEWERRAGGAGTRRDRLRRYLDGLMAVPGSLLIGAAVGAGMTAEAAERGGADFLIALSAGRLRVMGAPSIACLLPLSDSNGLVTEVARREILPRAGVPVFFGASVLDPAIEIGQLVEWTAALGFAGVVNFPTAAHLDGPFRAWLEAAGLGFAREVELMAAARAAGLGTLAYCRGLEELEAMAAAGVDMLCVNFGWNKGGIRGVSEGPSLDQASASARQLVARLRALSPETVCLLEGGPIVGPRDLHEACRHSRAQGYIGGSTIDRLPLESSVADVTSAFKAVESGTAPIVSPRGRIEGVLSDLGLQGPSAAADRLRVQVRKLAVSRQPVLLIAEEGSEELRLAAALAGWRPAAADPARRLSLADPGAPAALFGGSGETGRRRIGVLEAGDAQTLVIEHLEAAEPPVQAALRSLLETGGFRPAADGRWVKVGSRLIFTARPAIRSLSLAGRFDRDLFTLLVPGCVELPPLRDRLEDLPHLCRMLLAELRRGVDPQLLDLEQQAFRPLMAHDWPGNLRELRQVLSSAALTAKGRMITLRDVAGALCQTPPAPMRPAPAADERGWILDGLARNRFRRTETALYLGISRKTLYNKMRRYGLLSQTDGPGRRTT